MTANRLKRHAHKLVHYHKLKSGSRKKQFLNQTLTDPDFVKCLCDCAKNILGGRVPLSAKQLADLKKRKSTVRQLIHAKTSIAKKKKIIQTGGFLGALLSPIISILGGWLGQTFGGG